MKTTGKGDRSREWSPSSILDLSPFLDPQVEIVGQNKPLEIHSQPKPVRVELVRQNGFAGGYISVIDEKGAINVSGAIPVEIMARDANQLKPLQSRNGVLRAAP